MSKTQSKFGVTIPKIPELINVTYTEITALIGSNTLVPGQKYLITDYQTVHTIPTTVDTNTGPIEPLIVTALSVNELEPIAYSTLHPEDIIYYDVENNLTRVPGCTKGHILRRIDTLQNNDIPTDWRYVKYRRYALNVTNTYDVGTSYARGAVVIDGGTTIYVSLVGSNLGNSLSDKTRWITLTTLINGEYISHTTTNYVAGGLTIPVNNADFQDYTLFNGTYYVVNNTVKGPQSYNNILSNFNVVMRDYVTGTSFSFYNNDIVNMKNVNVIKSFSGNIITGIESSTVHTFNVNSGSGNITSNILKTTSGNSFTGTFTSNLSESIIQNCTFSAYFASSLIGNLVTAFGFFNNHIKGLVTFLSCTGSMNQNNIDIRFDPPDLTSLNVTDATHVYADYNKTWVQSSGGTYRLQYLDGSDIIQTVAITA